MYDHMGKRNMALDLIKKNFNNKYNNYIFKKYEQEFFYSYIILNLNLKKTETFQLNFNAKNSG